MNGIFKTNLYALLKKDSRLWDEQGEELNETLLKELVSRLDKRIIELFLSDEETKRKFFVKINNVFVFKPNDFKFFLDENKLDNSYTQYYANKIGLRVGNKLLRERDEVVLDWPFKDCVLEGGMTKEDAIDNYYEFDEDSGNYEEKNGKRKEIFFNEVLAQDEIDRLEEPKALVNWKRYTAKGEEKVKELKRDKDSIIRENLIIKGNNLLTLHSLKEQFTGKVKLIYIDPPFNRDADTFYNDNFKHSTWLTFMRNRLQIAFELLAKDSLIFVNIDDAQGAYLKTLMDEIFGRENFINSIAVRSSTPSGLKTAHKEKTIIKQKDYILVYKKGNPIFKPQYQKKEKWDTHYHSFFDKETEKIIKLIDVLVQKKLVSKGTKLNELNIDDPAIREFYVKNAKNIFQTAPEMPKDIKIKSKENPGKIIKYGEENGKTQYALNGRRFTFLSQTIKDFDDGKALANLLCDFWKDIDYQNTQNEGGVDFPSGKKPEALIRRILDMTTREGDLILDFHLGSGTTCAVAHKMNRQYIGIEQIDYGKNDPIFRMKNVIKGDQSGISKAVNWKGGGEFVYCELAKWNEEAKEKIIKVESFDGLVGLFDEMYERYFLNYNVKVKEFKEKIIKEENFKNLPLEKQKEMFVMMLDLNQMYVNSSEQADKKYNLSKEDIALSEKFYNKE